MATKLQQIMDILEKTKIITNGLSEYKISKYTNSGDMQVVYSNPCYHPSNILVLTYNTFTGAIDFQNKSVFIHNYDIRTLEDLIEERFIQVLESKIDSRSTTEVWYAKLLLDFITNVKSTVSSEYNSGFNKNIINNLNMSAKDKKSVNRIIEEKNISEENFIVLCITTYLKIKDILNIVN